MRQPATTRSLGSRALGSLSAAALAFAALCGILAVSGGSAQAQSQAAPQNTSEPRVSGRAQVGSTLSGTQGGWNGSPTSYAYQWVRCDAAGSRQDGSDCAVVGGATTGRYAVTGDDVGRRLRFRVTATNVDGSTTAASNPTAVVSPAQAQRPRNSTRPSISGAPNRDQVLHVNPGAWSGTQPITFSFQWLRCDAGGGNCLMLPGFREDAYTLREGDVDKTMRVQVVARNSAGQEVRNTAPTAAIGGPTGPPGAVKLPSGETSIPVSSVGSGDRLIVDRVEFSSNPVRSRTSPFTARVKVKDTRGNVVREALVFMRSTPLVTVGTRDQKTGEDGWITITFQPRPNFPALVQDTNVQFYVKAYRAGDPVLAGVAGARLVQVGLAP